PYSTLFRSVSLPVDNSQVFTHLRNEIIRSDHKTSLKGRCECFAKSAYIDHHAIDIATRQWHHGRLFVLEIVVVVVLHDNKAVFPRQLQQRDSSLGREG